MDYKKQTVKGRHVEEEGVTGHPFGYGSSIVNHVAFLVTSR